MIQNKEVIQFRDPGILRIFLRNERSLTRFKNFHKAL